MLLFSDRIRTDPFNRLIVPPSFGDLDKFTGRVKTDAGSASYETVVLSGKDEKKVKRVVLDGTWSLTENHDLCFHILGTEYEHLNGKILIIKGEIRDARSDGLVFRAREYENFSGLGSTTLFLKGSWRADENNRITFEAEKTNGLHDTLTFTGRWNIGENNELVYTYERTDLKTKSREERSLVFKGWWQLFKKRIEYRIEGSDRSFFSFKAELGSDHIRFNERKLEYTVGIMITRKGVYRRIFEEIIFYGRWMLNSNFSVNFEMSYPGRERKSVSFGVEKLTRKGDKFTVFLTDILGEKMGLSIRFEKAFSSDARLFLALLRTGKEFEITGGMTIKF